jgi:hypothetical protein
MAKRDVMKRFIYLFILLGPAILACNKPGSPDGQTELAGNWRMIRVTDNLSGVSLVKPAGVAGEVQILFAPASANGGSFRGNTPTNDIENNIYATGPGQSLSIPNLSMTKVMETSWGNEFVANIRDARSYRINGRDQLIIRTKEKELFFERY